MSPIARPTASRRTRPSGWSWTVSELLRAPNDAPAPRSSRISARHLEEIRQQLSSSDHAVLLFVAEVRLATGGQIARRLWSAASPMDPRARRARRTLGRLETWRVLDRLPRRVGGIGGGSASIVYGVGPAGRRLLAAIGFVGKRLGTPGERYARHTLAVTELVVRLHEADRAGDLELIALETEPRCWRAFLGPLGTRVVIKPDLFVRLGAGRALEDRWMIEVDLATEARSTVARKARCYVEHYRSGEEQHQSGFYPRVVWAVPNHHRREQIESALAALQPSECALFVVWLYDEVLGRLAAEARS